MTHRLLIMALSLTIANYFYQAVGPHDWNAAFDRSFFQSAALLYVWLALKLDRGISITTLTRPNSIQVDHER